MNYESSSTTSQRTITAFFDKQSDADAAVGRLVADGIPRTAISIVAGAGTTGSTTSTTGQDVGFWESLKDMFLPEEDHATYAEGLRRGGYIVTVRTDGAHYDRALDILDDEGTVDLDERSQTWRNEGWTGTSDTTTSSRSTNASLTGAAMTSGYVAPVASTTGLTTGAGVAATGASSATAETLTEGREEVIPITEEQLRVGKREVSHGRVRVRSYVVETPVQEQIGLREEQVFVERRPVDRAVTGNEALFTDRVIEAEETAQEAVVSKEARVKEELVLRKDAQERTETVTDTVRRTEVEVDDQRVAGGRTTTTTTDRKIS